MRRRLSAWLRPTSIAFIVLLALILVVAAWNHARVCGELSHQYTAMLPGDFALGSEPYYRLLDLEERYQRSCLSGVPLRLFGLD